MELYDSDITLNSCPVDADCEFFNIVSDKPYLDIDNVTEVNRTMLVTSPEAFDSAKDGDKEFEFRLEARLRDYHSGNSDYTNITEFVKFKIKVLKPWAHVQEGIVDLVYPWTNDKDNMTAIIYHDTILQWFEID